MEFRASKIMKSGFYYTNPKRKNPIKPLNQLFKYNFTMKYQKVAIIVMVFFPMTFPGQIDQVKERLASRAKNLIS